MWETKIVYTGKFTVIQMENLPSSFMEAQERDRDLNRVSTSIQAVTR